MHADTSRRQSGRASASLFEGPPGLSGNLWPVHPHRLKDELLSFWIVRTAHANRIKLQTFTTLGFGHEATLWNRDIDRSASDALLQELSAQTGSSVVELRGGMLSGYEGKTHFPYGHLYFGALHYLVTFLSTARGRRLLDVIEREAGWQTPTICHMARERFEQRPVRIRHDLLIAALWLLDDWPNRFVRAARACSLSQSRILSGNASPFWFESEIRLSLGAGPATPTPEEARQASNHLARIGKVQSTAAVGRLMGSRHTRAAKAYAKKKPTPMANADLQRAFEKLEEEIRSLRSRSSKRLILQRDRTILRLMQLTGWSARKLLGLTVSDATWLASMSKTARAFPGEVAGLLLTYLRDTRKYLSGQESGDALFIGWQRSGIGEKNWRLRMQRARQTQHYREFTATKCLPPLGVLQTLLCQHRR